MTPQQLYDYLYLGKAPEQPNDNKDKKEELKNELDKHSEEIVEMSDTDKKSEKQMFSEDRVVSDKLATSASHQIASTNQKIQRLVSTSLNIVQFSKEVMEVREEVSFNKMGTKGCSSQVLPLSNTSLETDKKGMFLKTGERYLNSLFCLGVGLDMSLVVIGIKYLGLKMEE